MSSVIHDLDLEDGPNQANDTPAKDADGVPYCRKHHCRMIQSSGGKKGNPKKYYQCKVSGCEETARVVKTDNPRIVPSEPQACPRCSTENTPVICSRDDAASSAAMVVVKCPICNWKSSPFVVPHLAAFQMAHRKQPPVEEIGLR